MAPIQASCAPRLRRSAIDVLDECIDRGIAAEGIGLCPTLRIEARARLRFGLFRQLAYVTDQGGTGALRYDIMNTDDPRDPYVISRECDGGRKNRHRAHESELVMELTDVRETLTHERNRLTRVAAPHRQHGAPTQRQAQVKRTCLTQG
jgi:hypothetical protein